MHRRQLGLTRKQRILLTRRVQVQSKKKKSVKKHRQTMNKIYLGGGVHEYTNQIKALLPEYLQKLIKEKLTDEEWAKLVAEMKIHYGNHKAIINMGRNFRNGFIVDPHLPGLNSAVLLQELWKVVHASPDARKHFKETLDWIASTCIQGVSHRLFIDYVAISSDLIMEALAKHIPRKAALVVMEF
jgi:hypothetical protein